MFNFKYTADVMYVPLYAAFYGNYCGELIKNVTIVLN